MGTEVPQIIPSVPFNVKTAGCFAGLRPFRHANLGRAKGMTDTSEYNVN
jgi:hypothetical protein